MDTPFAQIDTGVEPPAVSDADISGPSGEVKLKSSGSFIDKLGSMFKSKKDGGEKRAKKRKRTKDGDLDLNADLNLPSTDVSVDGNADAAGKASISGESDFIVVDTPTMPKKEGDVNVELGSPESSDVAVDVEPDFSSRGPKSPSLLRRIGMFFHIGGKSYNVDGEKKKKRRKVSTGSKEDIDADLGPEVSVRRDDSFTIPDAEFKAPSLGVSADASGAGEETGGISGSAQADTPSLPDTEIKAPSFGISTSASGAAGLSTGLSGSVSGSSQAEAPNVESNVDVSTPSVGGGASIEIPSAKGSSCSLDSFVISLVSQL